MGTNNKHSPSSERNFVNGSPNSKKSTNGQQQRPSPSKSINIKTPIKNNSPGIINNSSNKRLSGSCSPPNFSFFAGSKCFESPSAQSLPKPPMSWRIPEQFDEGNSISNSKKNFKAPAKSQRVRKSLNLSSAVETLPSSCAAEYAKQQQNSSFTFINSNDHYTHNLKLLLNVNA